MMPIFSREVTGRGAINQYGKLGYFLKVEYFVTTEADAEKMQRLFNKSKHIKFVEIDLQTFIASYGFNPIKEVERGEKELNYLYSHKIRNITKEY